MKVYRAEWISDDEQAEYEIREFDALRAAQDFARKKYKAVYLHTYAVESELLPCVDGSEELPETKDLRQWVYAGGVTSYKETNQ